MVFEENIFEARMRSGCAQMVMQFIIVLANVYKKLST